MPHQESEQMLALTSMAAPESVDSLAVAADGAQSACIGFGKKFGTEAVARLSLGYYQRQHPNGRKGRGTKVHADKGRGSTVRVFTFYL